MELLKKHAGGVTRLTLNRPEQRNALTVEIVSGLYQGISGAIADPTCRAIVIAGAGGNFCAGRDLKAFAKERNLEQLRAGDDQWAAIFKMLDEADTPSIAIVEGYAYAGGFTLAMGCDFVIAEEGAKFQVSEMRHGFPAAINTPVLSRLVGPRLALEMAMLGETFTAERLFRIGLINRLVAGTTALQAEADAFLGTLISRDAGAIGQTKRLNRAVRNDGFDDALNTGSLINTQVSLAGGFTNASKSLQKN
jgi:enoyl-CoA hydratase/carnithine racemase